MNLALRHDTCSALLSIPPGRHCQQEDLISHTVSLHLWGQTRRTWSHFYLHYWHCLTCLGLCSIAIGNRDGLPPNKVALCPACRAQLSVNSLMPLVTDRCFKLTYFLVGRNLLNFENLQTWPYLSLQKMEFSSHLNVKQMHPKQPGYGGECQLSPTDWIKSVNRIWG